MKRQVRWMLQVMTRNRAVRGTLLMAARHGLLSDAMCSRLPISATFQVRLPDSRTFWYKSTDRDGIGRDLYWKGDKAYYEPETTLLFYKLARTARVVVDAGANTGYFTLLSCAASDSCRVICFEPVPETSRLLADNIDLNAWTSRCEVRQEAVSDATGHTLLRIPYYHIQAAIDGTKFQLPEEKRYEVVLTTIDAACPSGADLIKLDIEGSEHKALAGMPRVLAESKPTIVIEVLPDGSIDAIHSILDPLGYRYFHLLTEGPREMERICPDQTISCRNYLCAARPDVIKFVEAEAIGSRAAATEARM